jgi:Uncharacterized protein, similar to the N-terminal domain of Lon protease
MGRELLWQSHYLSLGCVGRVVSKENLPDGRSNIVLQGICRYKILEENCDRTPYRQARIMPVPEEDLGPTDTGSPN